MNKHAEHIPGLVKYAMDRIKADPQNPGYAYYRNPNTGKIDVLKDRGGGAGYDPTAVTMFNAMDAIRSGMPIDTTPKQQEMLNRYAPGATGQPTQYVRYADPSLRNINTDSSSAINRYREHPVNQTRGHDSSSKLDFWTKPDANQARADLQDTQTLPVFRAYNKSTNFRDRNTDNLKNKDVFQEWEGYGDLPEGWGYYNPHTILQDQLRRDGKLGAEEALNVQQIPFLQDFNQRHSQNLQSGQNGLFSGNDPHNLPFLEKLMNTGAWWGSGAQSVGAGLGQVGQGVGLVGETPRVYVDHKGNLQYADASGYMKHGLQNVGLGAAETALAATGFGGAAKPFVGAARQGLVNKLKGSATDLGRGALNFGRKSLNVARHPVNTAKNYWKKTSPLKKGQHAVLADEWGSSAFGNGSNMEKIFGITGDNFNDSGESSTNPMSMGFSGSSVEAQQAANSAGPIHQDFQRYVVPEEFRKREAEFAAQQSANYVRPEGAPLDLGNPFAGTLSAPSSYTDSANNNIKSAPNLSHRFNWAPEGQDPQQLTTKGRYYQGFLGNEMDAYTSSREAAINARNAKQYASKYSDHTPEAFKAMVDKNKTLSDSYRGMITGYHGQQGIPQDIRDPNWQPEYVTNLRDKYNSRFSDTNIDTNGSNAKFWDDSFALGMDSRQADNHWYRDPTLSGQPVEAESVYKYNQQNPSHGSRFYPVSNYNFITPSAQNSGTSNANNPGFHQSGRLINPNSQDGNWDEGGVAAGGQFTESRWDPKTKNWAPHLSGVDREPVHSGPENAEADALFQPKPQVDEYQRYIPGPVNPYGQGGTQVMHNPNQ